MAVEIVAAGRRTGGPAAHGLTVIEGRLELPTHADEALSRARPSGDHAGRLRVAANLPYNVGSPILVRLVDLFSGLRSTCRVMLQREVADRLLAEPGTSDSACSP